MHGQFPVDISTREPLRATSLHLVPFAEEVPHTVIDMLNDSLVGRRQRAIAEVRGPAAQQAVQLLSYLRPGALVARLQKPADLRLDPLDALLGRACAQVPVATLGMVPRSQCIAEEVEALAPGILH